VATANAELGIVAASQVLAPGQEKEGDYWLLPASLFSPIKQDAVMLRSARDKAAANAFLRFICTQEAQEIFARYAYTTTSCMAADALIQ
jgi:molybdate transport system substrate-binding protein